MEPNFTKYEQRKKVGKGHKKMSKGRWAEFNITINGGLFGSLIGRSHLKLPNKAFILKDTGKSHLYRSPKTVAFNKWRLVYHEYPMHQF
jgi:hypothetical protein